MEQMQGLDAAFIALEQKNTPMHIGSLLIYDPSTSPNGTVRFRDILDFFGARLKLSKTMRRTMVKVPFDLDFPYWYNDPDFDLEFHIRHTALPQPGDWNRLWTQAARIFSRPLDMRHPPWEFTVIEGLDNVAGVSKGSYAVVFKVHHAAIDGLSGIDIMSATHTLEPTVEAPTQPDLFHAERKPSPTTMLAKGVFRGLLNPVRQMQVLGETVPGLVRAGKGIVKHDYDLQSIWNTPRTRFNWKVGRRRVMTCAEFDLEKVKEIRKMVPAAKVNDVMLAIIGGGMRKYLEAINELPETSLTCMAPISVRHSAEKHDMGNQVAAMIVPLGSDIKNPFKRLEAVHRESVKSKMMTNAIGARQMTEVSKATPLLYTGLAARLYSSLGAANVIKPIFNTIVTNVPGPPVPIYSSGAELQSMYGLLPVFDGLGLNHVVQSYRDKINVTVTACSRALPDPEFYGMCLEESYAEFVALLKKEKPKRKTSVKRKTAPKRKTAAKRKTAPKRKAAAKRKTAAKKKSAAKSAPKRSATARKTAAKRKPREKVNGHAQVVAKRSQKPATKKARK